MSEVRLWTGRPQRRSAWLPRSFLASVVAALGLTVAPLPLAAPAQAATVDATYAAQGPSPIIGGQTENVTPNNEVAGAVHAVVAHPSDPDILWIGTVNGGIWRTNNATDASPTWVPLTDQMPSLSIGALELDPTVASSTVLVAGIGGFSSFRRTTGPRTGIMRSTDGGTTWTPLGAAQLTGENISGVAARGNIIVVSANGGTQFGAPGLGGVFRSTNTGGTFTRLSGDGTSNLPNVGVFDLVGDPLNNARLYAAAQTGIFRSDDTGASWINVTNQVTGISAATTNNIELAVHNSGGNNVVYAGVVNNGQLNGLWRSTDQGANWTQLDTPSTNEGPLTIGIQPAPKPGSQGGAHFSILADRNDANLVYVGGDRQPTNPGADGIAGNGDDTFPNSIGATDFSGRLFRCDASLAAGNQCSALTHNGTSNNSAPHADSREMVFDANGDIIETDDGGVYRQNDPSTTNGVWRALNGNLQISEHHSCAYDNVADIILCGDQDTGAPEQSASGSSTWVTLSAGDGGFVAANDAQDPSIRFSSSNSLGAGSFLRRVCDASNVCVNSAPDFTVVGQGQTIQTFEAGNLPLYTPLFINDVDPTRLIVASVTRVYESTDSLDNLNIIVNSLPGTPTGLTRAVAYGGRQGGADSPGVLWYGTLNGQLFLRSGATGTPAQLPSWTNGAASDIVLDPQNWATAYVTNGSQVFRTTDAGLTFSDISGTLADEAPNAQIWSLEVVPVAGTSELAVLAGTDTGVFMTQTQNLGAWAELGGNLPNTHAFDLEYDATDDVLLVGTLGRGAWLLHDLSDLIPVTDIRVTKTDSPDPVKAGEELFYTVTVTNEGPDKAVGVVVVDDLPDEVIYLEDNADCTYDAIDHQLTCPLDDIPVGSSTSFTIKTLVKSDAVVNEDDGTLLIKNTVSVGSVSVDSDTSNNTATTPTFVQEEADLKVTKVCKPDDALLAGETGTCTIHVDNVGPSAARDVVLRDTNISNGGFTFGAITASQGSCGVPVDGVVTCQLGDLDAASPSSPGRATVTVEVSATEKVDINDVADARSPTPDPDTANNQAQDSINVMAVADMSITKTGPATAVAGTDITYSISIRNNGPSTAQGVVVEDLEPAAVEILSVSGSGGATCDAGVPGNPLAPTTCSFGTLSPGAIRTMTINVRVKPDTLGTVHDDARVSSATFDDDLSNNLATVPTDVEAKADLALAFTSSSPTAKPSTTIHYQLRIDNLGPSNAVGVIVTVDLPPEKSGYYVSDDGTCTLSGVTLTCALGLMVAGSPTRTIFVDWFVQGSKFPVVTSASVASPTPDPIPANNSATVTVLKQ